MKGLIVPIISPRENRKIDNISLTKLVNFLIENHIDGIFALGTNGEFQYISFEEKKEIVATIAKANQQRISLLVGVSTNSEKETYDLIDFAQDQKADAIVLTPLLGEVSPDEKIATVLEYSHVPVMLYNNPTITNGGSLDVDVIKAYIDHPLLFGIKDSSGDRSYFQKLLNLANEKFSVFQGDENLVLEALAGGASGVVAGSANVLPSEFSKVVKEQTNQSLEDFFKLKAEFRKLSPNAILATKKKLVQMRLIASGELFQ